MVSLIVAVLAVILGSGLCSGTEAALLSVSTIRARQLAQSGKRRAVALLQIREKINRPITTIVVFNNVFNIVGSIVVGTIAATVFGEAWLGVFSGVLTFLIIVFSEILPKTLGERFAEPISLAIAVPIRAATVLFTPLVWLIERITAPITGSARVPTTNEAEIRFLAGIGRTEGIIEADEAEMIHRVFQLNDLSAGDVMTPRVMLTTIEGGTSLGDQADAIIASPHSRLVVIDGSVDRVTGIALKDELLAAIITGRRNEPISNLARPARLVDDRAKVDELLRNFRRERQHLMVVVDEFGGVAGVVTLEDVLEVLTGEIVDETDAAVNLQAIARRRRSNLLAPGDAASSSEEEPTDR
mgnify:CR=1 FL=1